MSSSRKVHKDRNKRIFSAIGLNESTAQKILGGLSWPEPAQCANWDITPQDQLHATLSSHGMRPASDLRALKHIYKDVSKRHPPIEGATLRLRNNFANANQFREGGRPYIPILHFDEITHFKLTQYWLDLQNSLGAAFRSPRRDQYLHVTVARIPYEAPDQAFEFIKKNRDFEVGDIDITPELFESFLDHNGRLIGGYISEARFPLLG